MSDLTKAQKEYDKVLIKYEDKECAVALIKGNAVFIGRSLCHENDNFNRKLGRTIALGRAVFAEKVRIGDKSDRDNNSCSHEFDNEVGLEAFITRFLPTRKNNQETE